jgi:hypothetical protein
MGTDVRGFAALIDFQIMGDDLFGPAEAVPLLQNQCVAFAKSNRRSIRLRSQATSAQDDNLIDCSG